MAARETKIKYDYDMDADVLYVRFGDDEEPSFIENLDDILLLEVGWFSGLPKGFRILGPRYHKMDSIVTTIIKRVKKEVRELMEDRRKAIKEQEPILDDF